MSTELTVLDRAKIALRSTDHEPVLVELVKQTADIREIKNADGRTQAHSSYMALKNRRTDIRRVGKEARDDATKFSKAVIAEEDRLVSIIEPEETRLQTLRDTWDAARESERREKAQAAQRRKDEIRDKISQLRAIPVNLVDATPERIANAIADVEAFEVVAADFDDQIDVAHLARTDVLAKLADMHASAVRRAAEAAQLAAERAELERQRAEQAERERVAAAERAEQERIDRERREVEDAQRRAEQAAEQRRIDEQRAEIARQQAAIDAERQHIADEAAARQRAADEAEAAARREREEAAAAERRAQAEREAAERLAHEAAEAARLKEIDELFPVRPVAATAPMLREFPTDALRMLEDVLLMIAEPVGLECCGRAGDDCCGDAMPVYRNADEIAAELSSWRDEIIALQTEAHKEAA